MRRGLTARLVVATGALAAVVGGALAVLVVAEASADREDGIVRTSLLVTMSVGAG